MKKQDLKDGMIIETRENLRFLIKTGYTPLGVNTFCNLVEKSINEDLTNKYECSDIMKVILRNLPEKWKWIARDKNCSLFVYGKKPKKIEPTWFNFDEIGYLSLFNHLFQFIKWEDEEPYCIKDLLEERD